MLVGGFFFSRYAFKKADKEQKYSEVLDRAARKRAKEQWEERERIRQERINTSPIKDLTPIEFEEYTAQYLRDRGYRKVKLTPTTGDYGADVLAVTPEGKKICIQCKRYNNPVGIHAVQEINAAKGHYKCDIAAIAVTSAGYTKQAIVLAKDLSVLLYSYNDLSREFVLHR